MKIFENEPPGAGTARPRFQRHQSHHQFTITPPNHHPSYSSHLSHSSFWQAKDRRGL